MYMRASAFGTLGMVRKRQCLVTMRKAGCMASHVITTKVVKSGRRLIMMMVTNWD